MVSINNIESLYVFVLFNNELFYRNTIYDSNVKYISASIYLTFVTGLLFQNGIGSKILKS